MTEKGHDNLLDGSKTRPFMKERWQVGREAIKKYNRLVCSYNMQEYIVLNYSRINTIQSDVQNSE